MKCSGLPDGIFSNQIWMALEWKMLVHIMAIWNILQPFGNLVVSVYMFPRFGLLYQKIWQPCSSFGLMSQEISGNPKLQFRC
jgi:hypothetical protein